MKYHDSFFSGKYYHIYNHVVGKENLFVSDDNYNYFLKKYAYHAFPVVKTIAYNLMPNHFHFIIRVRDEESLIKRCMELLDIRNERAIDIKSNDKTQMIFDASKFNIHKFVMQQFSNLFTGYAQAFNKQQNRKGALFIDYLKRTEVSNEIYLKNLIAYVHYNAVHHGFCKHADDWKYSSYRIPLLNAATKLERETILHLFETKEGYKKYHQDFKDIMDDDLEFH